MLNKGNIYTEMMLNKGKKYGTISAMTTGMVDIKPSNFSFAIC